MDGCCLVVAQAMERKPAYNHLLEEDMHAADEAGFRQNDEDVAVNLESSLVQD